MRLHILNENLAILDLKKPAAKYIGIFTILFGIFLEILGFVVIVMKWGGEIIVFIFGIITILLGLIATFHKKALYIDRQGGKITHKVRLLGLINRIPNVWDLNTVEKAELDIDDLPDPDGYHYGRFNLKFTNGETKKLFFFDSRVHFDNILKHFNLFIKGKYSTPGIIKH